MATGVFYLPFGQKNIESIYPGVDWMQVKQYYIVVETADGSPLFQTPNVIYNCCCPDDRIRLHFLNNVGGFDAVNFLKPHVVHEDTNDQYQNGLNYPLQKTDTGIERFNIKSNDTYEATCNCNEADMPWLRELWDSSKIFLEWTGTEGQPDDYIPVVKVAGKFDLLKNSADYQYQFVIQFTLSNDYINMRN